MFLAQAFEELVKGDLPQASEKGWGAAALIVKAIANERNWHHNSHRSLHDIVNRLHRETADSELRSLFLSANSLHRNFYEDAFSTDSIEARLRRVRRFVDKAEELLGGYLGQPVCALS